MMTRRTEEIQAQRAEIERRKQLWYMADNAFEESAWLEYLAAERRLKALITESREVQDV